jgi:conjugative relaxase-like TrwC/TraI family protein
VLTIKVQTVKLAAEKYFEDHLAKGEYVTEGEGENHATAQTDTLTKYYTDQPVTWSGKTAALLGLKEGEIVTREQFSLLLENKNPSTGEDLTARTNVKGRRLYFDATVSAPKSVSVMAITMGDTKLIKAHEEASNEALKSLEAYTQTRVRKGGLNTVRKTHNFLAASVTHTTSRANDPQLHTHNLIFNVTWDETEQKFKALEAYEIYNNVEYFTEQYRNILATKVIEMGYQIERAKHGWEIKGVSKEICDLFSKRSAAIKEAEKALEASRGRPITNQERAILTEQTRKKKSKNLTHEMAVEQQKSELTKEQLASLNFTLSIAKTDLERRQNLREKLNKRFGPANTEKSERDISIDEKEAVAFAIAHLFERQSVVKKNEILALALKTNYGKVTPQNLEKALAQAPNLIWDHDKGTVGTIDGLAKELFVCSFIEQNKGKLYGFGTIDETKLNGLRDDQKQAFKEIYQSPDKVMILEGGAGTGKSHLLKALTEALKEKNIVVTATAPTTGATQNLNKDIGVKAETIQKILHKPSFYEKSLQNGYLIVDEAGLLSLKQMEALFLVADKYHTQILLVGDTKQHHGVEAGDALRAIKLYTDIQVARLTEIERQKLPEYKEAVRDLMDRNVQKAWAKFEKMGAIHSKDDYLSRRGTYINYEDLEKKLDTEKLFKTYLEKTEAGKSVIVVTPTRTEVQNLTAGIRNALKEKLGQISIEKEVFASVRFTEAEKMTLSQYVARGSEAHFVTFMDTANGFAKGSNWKVKEIHQEKALLESLSDAKLQEFHPKEFLANQFDVVERKTIEIKAGETLHLQKNERVELATNPDPELQDSGQYKRKALATFTNGELVKVKKINEGQIYLEDGRKLTESIKHLDYGYVSTSYSAQGKTCDHVIVAMTNAGGRALTQEQFYVSTSRGREGIDIFVEDKEFIKTRIEAMGDRVLNLEMMSEKQKHRIKEMRGESIASLKEKSFELASQYAIKENAGDTEKLGQLLETQNWKARLREKMQQTLEPLQERIHVILGKDRKLVAKERYPMEKEPQTIREKLWSKNKGLELEK